MKKPKKTAVPVQGLQIHDREELAFHARLDSIQRTIAHARSACESKLEEGPDGSGETILAQTRASLVALAKRFQDGKADLLSRLPAQHRAVVSDFFAKAIDDLAADPKK